MPSFETVTIYNRDSKETMSKYTELSGKLISRCAELGIVSIDVDVLKDQYQNSAVGLPTQGTGSASALRAEGWTLYKTEILGGTDVLRGEVSMDAERESAWRTATQNVLDTDPDQAKIFDTVPVINRVIKAIHDTEASRTTVSSVSYGTLVSHIGRETDISEQS